MKCPKCSFEIKVPIGKKVVWCTEHQEFHEKQYFGHEATLICPDCTELARIIDGGNGLRALTDDELFKIYSEQGDAIAASRRVLAKLKNKEKK